MDIFISWSGPRSGAVANALKGWLPKIVNAFKPWLSSADIDKGARWSADIATRLQAAKAGIICLTPSNLSAPWILFEAGALSKTLENTFVCPLLVDLEPRDVTGPLSQFQATRAARDEMLQLLKTLNGGLLEAALPEAHVDEVFEVWWPRLEAELKGLPADGPAQRPHRTDRELLEEIVDSLRGKASIDAQLSARTEEGIMDLRVRLDHATHFLESRLVDMQHRAADSNQEMWARLGRVFANSDPALRAYEESNAEMGRQMTAVAKAERKTKAKTFLDEERGVDPKAEP
jgi:TIR domain